MTPSRISTRTTSETEIKVSEGFADLHAQLQIAEEKIRANIVSVVNSSYTKLVQVAAEVDNHVKALTGLLDSARIIINGGGNQKKINVQMVVDKLKNVSDLPCCLVGKQINQENIRYTVYYYFI